jgi:hypothetical protein
MLKSAEALIKNPALVQYEPQYEQSLVPERVVAEAYTIMGKWDQAAQAYRRFAQGANNPFINFLIDELSILKLEQAGNLRGALEAARGLQSKYRIDDPSSDAQSAARELQRKISGLEQKLGIAPATVALGLPQ